MIPTNLTDKDYKQLAQRLASHITLKDSFLKLEIKPARKGKIYGKGGTDKKPKFEIRIKATFSDEFKKLVSKEIDKIV